MNAIHVTETINIPVTAIVMLVIVGLILFNISIIRSAIEYVLDKLSGQVIEQRKLREEMLRDKSTSTNPQVYTDDSQFRQLGRELTKAYKDRRIRNIAITGPISSGKSSFVLTYESLHARPFREYLKLTTGSKNQKKMQTPEDVEIDLVRQIFTGIRSNELREVSESAVPARRRFPLIEIIVVVWSTAALIVAFNSEKLENLVPKQYADKLEGYALIFFILSLLPLVWAVYRLLDYVRTQSLKIKIGSVGEAELSFKDNNINSRMNELIRALAKMRRRIAFTVVIEDLEEDAIGGENCRRIHANLMELNRQLNIYLESKHSPLIPYTPVRFLYVFRDGLYNAGEAHQIFDKEINLDQNLSRATLSSEINNLMQKQFGDEERRPQSLIEGKYHLDQGYLDKLVDFGQGWLLIKRNLNGLIADYAAEWRTLTRKLGCRPHTQDDETRLFSYVLYKELFPNDQRKMKGEASVIFSFRKKKDLAVISEKQNDINLLYYLTNECPEPYRLSFLCMRYVNFEPSLMEQHLEDCEKALLAGDYLTALKCINRVIVCDPENSAFYGKRAEVYAKLKKKGSAKRDRETMHYLSKSAEEEIFPESAGEKISVGTIEHDMWRIQTQARLYRARQILSGFFKEMISGTVISPEALEQKISDYQLCQTNVSTGENVEYTIRVPEEEGRKKEDRKKGEVYMPVDVCVTVLINPVSKNIIRVLYHNFRDYVDVFCKDKNPAMVLIKDFTLLKPADYVRNEEGENQGTSVLSIDRSDPKLEKVWNYTPIMDRGGGVYRPFLEKLHIGMSINDIAGEVSKTGLCSCDIESGGKCVSFASDIQSRQDGSCVYLYFDEELLDDVHYYDYVIYAGTDMYLRQASGNLAGRSGKLYPISEGYYVTDDRSARHFNDLQAALQELEQYRIHGFPK